MTQLLTCAPPSANARDSRHPHPPGLAPGGGVETCPQAPQPAPAPALRPPHGGEELGPSSAPARAPGSCSPQTLRGTSGGHAQLSACALQRLDWGGTWWGHGTRSGGQTGCHGRALGPGVRGWPGHAAAGRGLRGLRELPVACQDLGRVPRSLAGQEQADSRGPRPGPHRPHPAPSPQKTGSGQNYG